MTAISELFDVSGKVGAIVGGSRGIFVSTAEVVPVDGGVAPA